MDHPAKEMPYKFRLITTPSLALTKTFVSKIPTPRRNRPTFTGLNDEQAVSARIHFNR